MSNGELFDELKDLWGTFCGQVLSEPGKRGVYSGANMVFVAFGDHLLDGIESLAKVDWESPGE